MAAQPSSCADTAGTRGSQELLETDSSMAKEYIEQRNGGYFIKGVRVSLDSVVYAFLRGESPEGIADSFPSSRAKTKSKHHAWLQGNRMPQRWPLLRVCRRSAFLLFIGGH